MTGTQNQNKAKPSLSRTKKKAVFEAGGTKYAPATHPSQRERLHVSISSSYPGH